MAHTAPFRRSGFRFTGSILIAAASSAALLLSGCDNDMSKADKQVSEQLDQAEAQMAGAPADQQKAGQTLDAAARETAASLPQKIRAKSMMAQNELQLAQTISAQILSNDALIDRLSREILLLGGQIQSNNQMAAALAQYEPTAAQAALKQKTADVTGSDDKPDWYKSDATTLASLSANDKLVASLQADVSKYQDAIKSDTDQRNQLLDQADKVTEQSQHVHGQQSVDLYVQGSNARKQAADLSVKLDEDNTALLRAQADLALRQGQHESMSTTLKGFDDKTNAISNDWKSTGYAIADLNTSSKKLLGEDPVTPPSRNATTGDLKTDMTIGSKAAAIVDLAKKNHDARAIAETHFNSAISFYKEAYDLATSLRSDIGAKVSKADPQKPEVLLAWPEELSTFEPSLYHFLEADAQQQRAEFFVRSASESKTRLQLDAALKPILTAVQLTPYPTMDEGDLAEQQKKASDSARDDFKDAADLLSTTSEGTGPDEVKNAAKVQEIFAQYGWALLEAANRDSAKAAEHLSLAKTAAAAAVSAGISLPALPSEITPSASPAMGAPK